MTWPLAAVGGMVMLAGVLWLLSKMDGRGPGVVSRRVSPVSPPPATPRGGYEAAERLDLPSGPEGHLMVAREIEQLGRLYGAAIEARMHQRGRP